MYKPREGIQRGGALIGVEPTAMTMAINREGNMGNKGNKGNTGQGGDAVLNSVKMSLKDEFSGDGDEPSAGALGALKEWGKNKPGAGTDLDGSNSNSNSNSGSNSNSSKMNVCSSSYYLDSIYAEDGSEESVTEASRNNSRGPHLIFLQHGFKGCAYDMRLLRNAITTMFPDNTQVYAAESNEKESDVSIELMGQRLAIEVHQYIKSREPKVLKDPLRGRVSFIGHSVGGLIIRKALESELLKPLLCKLHMYISLASPHLGTLYADSQLVASGMWALFKLQKAAVLRELSLDDVTRSDMTKSLLYRLSENGVFMYFKWVVFASSPKDQYVPQYSARVQVGLRINLYVSSEKK
jgi:hypothetical protein